MKKRIIVIGLLGLSIIAVQRVSLNGKNWIQKSYGIINSIRFLRIADTLEKQKKQLVKDTAEHAAKNLILVNVHDRHNNTAKKHAFKYVQNEEISNADYETIQQGMRHSKDRMKALRAIKDFYERHYEDSEKRTIAEVTKGAKELDKKIERILK